MADRPSQARRRLDDFTDLSDGELRARLMQRGWSDAEAATIIDRRDDPRVAAKINEVLNDA